MNIPEERSGRRQDITVCRQRLSIFLDQGNISKRCPGGQSRPFLGDYWDFYFYMVCSEPVASASSSLREKEHTYH